MKLQERINQEGFTEIYNPDVDAYIETPVYKAVGVLNKFRILTSSSGFHSHFSEKFNGLKPCWCIMCEGLIPKKIRSIAERKGFNVRERFPLNKNRIYSWTEIYLPNEIANEKDLEKAKKIFDEFASKIELSYRHLNRIL